MNKIVLAFALLAPAPVLATDMYECDPVAAEDWLSEAQLTEKIGAEGWMVNRMKKDGGCWEVYGRTPQGKRVEAYFHPKSGEVVLINQRGKILYRAEN